jgi:hypothetical protein
MPPFIPEKLRLLAQQCWHQDPKQRPEFSEVLVLSSAFHFLAMPWSNYFGRTCGISLLKVSFNCLRLMWVYEWYGCAGTSSFRGDDSANTIQEVHFCWEESKGDLSCITFSSSCPHIGCVQPIHISVKFLRQFFQWWHWDWYTFETLSLDLMGFSTNSLVV